MDEILHTPREESSAIRPPLAQLRDRWEAQALLWGLQEDTSR